MRVNTTTGASPGDPGVFMSQRIQEPNEGHAIEVAADGTLNVPNDPILTFIEGDGTGADIWRASVRVFDAAIAKAYGGARKAVWHEVYAGEKCFNLFGEWCLPETIEHIRKFKIGIKGPLTTPVGGGIRSLNVALRAAGAVVHGRAEPGEEPGAGGHGDLPRELGRHLRRHRVGRRIRRGPEADRLPPGRDEGEEDPVP
jgi:hypothetical protein